MPKPSVDVDFAIVGAGLAGLRAAVELQRLGNSVKVLEARDRVGGRVFTITRPGSSEERNLVLDLGGQWLGPGQTDALRLVQELGLHTVPVAVHGRSIWLLNGERHLGGPRVPPIGSHALLDLMIAGSRLALMYRRVPPDAPWTASKAEQWDLQSAEDWLSRHVHTDAGRALIRLFIEGNMAITSSETSLLGLLFDIRTAGSLYNVARAETFRLLEGTQEFARRLAIPIWDNISFEDPVLSIRHNDKYVEVESNSMVVNCRRVAVCVPPPLANEIQYDPSLPDERCRFLSNVQMGSCIKFHAAYPEPFWRERGLNGQAVSDKDVVGLTYDNSPHGAHHGVLVGFVLADRARQLSKLETSKKKHEIALSLGRIFSPDAADPESITIQDWNNDVWTRGAYAAHFPPSVWTTVGRSFRAPCGRIHWGGTETSIEWHGYMEGALRSGMRVAREMHRPGDPDH